MNYPADFMATDGHYLAEIDGALLSIIRASDGAAIHFHGRAFVKAFRESVAGAGIAQAIRVYLKIAPYQAADKGRWSAGPYKAGRVPAIIAELTGGAPIAA